MTVRKLVIMGTALSILAFAGFASAAPHNEKADRQEWTLEDTVSSAINYAPSVKREQEGIRMAEENVRQAQAGHLPRVDVQASTGASTLPVSKYE